MAILDIRINNRSYQIACDDGQESHVRELARAVDARVQEMARAMGGQVADGTLLALTALMLTDELNEANSQKQKLQLQMGNTSQSFEQAKQTEIEIAVADALSGIGEDINALARSIADKPIAKT